MKKFKEIKVITAKEKIQLYIQYREIYGSLLLLFRVGDWYEAYVEDAQEVANTLNIVVTEQDGLQMAAFPHQALDTYLPRLIRAGHKIAICDLLDQ